MNLSRCRTVSGPLALLLLPVTVEPRYNEGPRDWQSLFAIPRFFFKYLTITGVKKIPASLYRGLRHIEVRYIEVPLYEYNRPVSSCPKARLSARLFKC